MARIMALFIVIGLGMIGLVALGFIGWVLWQNVVTIALALLLGTGCYFGVRVVLKKMRKLHGLEEGE